MVEQDLLKKVRDKDLDAISKLYLESKSSFVKYIKKYAGVKTDEAEEIYQESFYILFLKIKEGGSNLMIPDMAKYLFGIGRNIVSNQYKQQKRIIRDISDGENLSIDTFKDLRDYLENDTKQEIIRKVVLLLTEPCKTILNKFYWEKLSYSEILPLIPNFSNIDSLKAQKHKCMSRVTKTTKEMFKIAELD